MDNVGAIIEEGASDWQIVQRGDDGSGVFDLRGRWVASAPGKVEVRLVDEATGVPACMATDWRAAETAEDGTWSARVEAPGGGLYRLETRLNPVGNAAGEWSTRGDMRHFLGVGDLWVIAGQSNSAGYGRGPLHDPPELGVHLFRNSETWALATHPLNESTDTRHPANREGGNPVHSPYLHFARVLKQQLGIPIGLVQTSLGGSPLSSWNPAQGGDAVLFHNMLHCVRQAGGRVRGVLWYQGESDTGTDDDAATYADRFIAAVGAWREALGSPELPVITVQLNRWLQPPEEGIDRRWTQVREAQRQVPRRLPGVAVVPAFDLPLSDGIHISPAGNLLLADRMARAALGLAYGKRVDYLAPEVRSARREGDREIVLRFAPVISRVDTIDPAANPFWVEDEAGAVPVAQVSFTGTDAVRLTLGREPRGSAMVHGGHGVNPATVPMDMERFLPMLGFYGVPVA